ncbi:MAG: ABC transporter ATP-binding protein [Verrucomicrobia bacterium]|nr:ABC transporter ATP-binding protein [Verrucomicrobiota bacterium]MCH8511091.1 ABC transporter ATP-binding protein [Kiritimatiellia bacterium]
MSDKPKEIEPLLQVKNLSVTFQTDDRIVNAVNDVSFDVKPGEVLGLVGESGSGKTVTGMSILRLVPTPPGHYDSGEILFEGEDILKMRPEELRRIRGSRISAIFQEPMTALSPLKTVGNQLKELLDIHHPDWSKKQKLDKVIEWLDKVGIPDPENRRHQFPFQFSGGMRQRVTIAMALMLEPRLVIADEPTTALDVTLQAQVFDLMMKMKADKTSLIFITHDMGVVWELSDRVLVMKDAKLVEEGPVESLFVNPREEYTQKLLNAVPRLDDVPVRANHEFPETPILETVELQTWFPIKGGLLSRTTGHVKAVDGVTMQIREGETLGVVGESGSGKSTLGRTLIGLENATGGSVFYEDRPIHDLWGAQWRPIRRQVQMIFQDPYSSLNGRLKILDLLSEAPVVHGIIPKTDPDYVANCLEEVGLKAEMMYRYPHEFSGGQRQRICIARALALKPKIIICDEAVSALDVTIQAQILDLLMELRERHGLAYLFISHDLSVVKRICDHVLVMRQGQVVEEGPPSQVVDDPQHEYTQKLLAAVPSPGDPNRRRR